MIEPELQNETIERVIEPLAKLSRQAGVRKENLFLRLARKRAEYFADIEGLQPDLDFDELPTQRYSAFLQAVGLSLTPLGVLPLEEQPTKLLEVVSLNEALTPVEMTSPDEPVALAEMTSPTVQAEPVNMAAPTVQAALLVAPVSAVQTIELDETDAFNEITEAKTLLPEALEHDQSNDTGACYTKMQLRGLLKSSGIYALASLAVPLVGLVLSPFLTHNMSRVDYGALAVLNTTIALMAGLSQLGLGSAFFRVYTYEYETTEARLRVLSTTLGLLLVCTIPLTVLAFVLSPLLARGLLGDTQMGRYIQLAALVVLVQNFTVPGMAWMRAEGRAGNFALLSITNLLVNLSMTIFLVGWCRLGIGGALFATSCGYAVMLLGTLPRVLLHIGKFVLKLDIARGLLAFGLPNAVSFAASWVLQLADRFLLAHMRSLTETATYSVAYTLGGALSVVVLSPFALAWPSTLFLIAKRKDAQSIFRLIFRWYSLGLLFMAYALSLASLFVLNVFFPATYQNAAAVIPLVTLSTMFYGLYNYLTLGMNIRKKIWYAVLFISLAAVVNIGANCLLIPFYGSLGAAVATLIAYILLAVLTYLLNRRIYPVQFEIGLFGLGLGLTVGSYLSGMLLAQGRPIWAFWSILCGMLLFCGLCLCALGKLWALSGRAGQKPAAKNAVEAVPFQVQRGQHRKSGTR